MLASLLSKIKKGLAKTRDAFTGVVDLFRGRGKVDKAFLDQLEQKLYLADVGGYAVGVIVDRVRQAYLTRKSPTTSRRSSEAAPRHVSDPSGGLAYAPTGRRS